jgi:hypothetical protein
MARLLMSIYSEFICYLYPESENTEFQPRVSNASTVFKSSDNSMSIVPPKQLNENY